MPVAVDEKLEQVPSEAADRWVAAVNADGTYGRWQYAVAKKPEEVRGLIDEAAKQELPCSSPVHLDNGHGTP
jgi:type III restriction enzyme